MFPSVTFYFSGIILYLEDQRNKFQYIEFAVTNNTLFNSFKLLDYLATAAKPVSVKELAEHFSLPNSHVCRLLKTLTEPVMWNNIPAHAIAMFNLACLYKNGHIDGKRDYVKAKKYYEMAIKYNDATAMNNLGMLYANGQVGGKRDYVKAKELFEKAIKYNNADAMYNLALLYENGHIDGTRDYVKAEELYEMAIKYNNASAMFNLALLYANGHIDGERDYVKAKELFEMAIKYNHATAMNNLGVLYENGHIGGKRDYVKAKEYYEMAIKYNHATAMFNLGVLYYFGRVGGKRDYKKALTLFNNAVNANELVYGNFGIGMIYEEEDKLRLAEKHYKRAQQALTESYPPFLHEGIKNKLKIVENLNLGFVYLQKGNYEKAKECFQEAKNRGSAKANDALKKLEIY